MTLCEKGGSAHMPKKKEATKKTPAPLAKKTPKKDKKTEKTEAPVSKPSKKVLSMDDLLKQQTITPPKKGEIIHAKIAHLSKKGILFDIGWKSYAVLGNLEAQDLNSYLPYLHEGDVLPIKVVVEEAKEGYPVVSMRSFFEKGKWEILEQKYKDESEIEVICGEYGKGGVFVDFMGVRGVIPKIQLTEDLIREPEKLQGKKIKVKVLEVDHEKNRLVVSQKASALNISYKDIKAKFDAIKIGDKYKAKIIGFSDFGAFCEVEKIEGLIHISEISWQKVSDPRRHLKIGDIVDVVVVEKNPDNLKLNLSIKRLEKDPWEDIEKRYPKDKEVKGEVVGRERYGYIVRLEPGVEGLVHVSKLKGDENVEIGKEITLYIEKMDAKNRRISLVLGLEEKPVMYR